MGDQLAVMLGAEIWAPINGGRRFMTTELRTTWRLSRDDMAPWHALVGTTLSTADAPLALWPGASAGRGRGVLLRAHPLHDSGTSRATSSDDECSTLRSSGSKS